MIEIIGVKFKSTGKVYSFAAGNFNPPEGIYVVVQTARGLECGEVAIRRHAVAEDSLPAPVKPIVRIATAEDMKIVEKKRQYIANAFRICEEKIAKRKLPMRLIDVESGFDSNKLIFYFSAESRVDFRDLVKDLAQAFHVRIELRQIGDRDEAKLIGGLGICGREFCCKKYLKDFQPITIKMAKEQGLALNPTKISGTCGRLMCCLHYENAAYEELIRITPKAGSTVLLPGDPPVRAYVMEANLISGMLRVKPENADMTMTVKRDEVEPLQDASRRMTKEDLRPKPQVSTAEKETEKPSAKAKAKSRHNTDGGKKPEKGQPKGAAKTTPKPPAEGKPVKQAGDAPAKQGGKQSGKPAAQSPAPAGSALHPEFGERIQPKQPAPKPVPKHRTPPIPQDLTERRAKAQNEDN